MTSLVLTTCAIGLLIGTQPAVASSLESIFQSGNRAFATGNTRQAIQSYHQLIKFGVDDPDVYFNLGTAYARLEKYGHAIRCFERAARLQPGDDSIDRNLRLAMETLNSQHAQKFPGAITQTQPPLRYALLRDLTVNTLALAMLFLNLLAFGLLGARAFCSPRPLRLGLSVVSGVAAFALVVSVLLLFAKLGMLGQGRDAVVLKERASLTDRPSIEAIVRGQALQGERALIHEQEGKFYRVTFTDGRRGWMHLKDVGEI